jgi:hypothetical protein
VADNYTYVTGKTKRAAALPVSPEKRKLAHFWLIAQIVIAPNYLTRRKAAVRVGSVSREFPVTEIEFPFMAF